MSPCLPRARVVATVLLLTCARVRADEPATDAPPLKLEPFTVTGSMIKRVDFEGPSPIRVIDRQQIELNPGTGLTDVLHVLPEATGFDINENSATGGVRGATGINLRSLGAGNTLVLVNGRRQAPNGIDADGVMFVDPNRFPAAMVERIEVLKDGASAIYGADATAGVINIILRSKYQGTELAASYGNYFKTDGAERSASVLVGGQRGRLRALLGLTASSRNAIAASDLYQTANADQTEYFRALDPVKYAEQLKPQGLFYSFFDGRSPVGPYATVNVPTVAQLTAPANGLTVAAIRNPLTGVRSTFLPGTGGVPQGTLGNNRPNRASVPFTNNNGRPTPAQFGPLNFGPGELSNLYNFNEFMWDTSQTRRFGLTGDFGYTVNPSLELYGTLTFSRLHSLVHLAPTPINTVFDNAILVPASNYYNPFGIPLAFTYRPLEVGPRIGDVTSKSFGSLLGVRGRLADRFDWDLAWSYSTNQSVDRQPNSLSEAKTRAALAKSTPDALNIFGGPGFRNDPATIEGIKITAEHSGNASTALADFHLSSTDLLALPTGPLGGSVLFEHRLERYDVTNDPYSSTLDDVLGVSRGPAATTSRRTVDSAAVEARLPLVPEKRWWALPLAELSVAARFEKFSDGYDSGVKPYAGLRVHAGPHLLLRASYSKVFRAPSLTQLYAGTFDVNGTGPADLRRPVDLTLDSTDANTAPRLYRVGGNPLLRPEDGTTRQAGFVFDVPGRLLRGLSIEGTVGEITQDNVITGGLDSLFILQNELTSTGALVIREPGSENYTNTTGAPIEVLAGAGGVTSLIQPGQTVTVPGRITMIVNSAVNLSNQTVRYCDFGLSYEHATGWHGTFTASTNWTYYDSYKFSFMPGDEPVSSVGRDLPRYRGQTSASWRAGRWSFTAGLNYIAHYRSLELDGWEVARYSTVSATIGYKFPDRSRLHGARVTLGCDNLLDQDFPADAGEGGYNRTLVGRPGGRYGYVSLKREF